MTLAPRWTSAPLLKAWLAFDVVVLVLSLAATFRWSFDDDGACFPLSGACRPDGKTGRFCSEGKYIDVPCRGPKGCEAKAGKITCDLSENVPGDRCAKPTKLDSGVITSWGGNEGEGQCAADGKALIICRDGSIERMPCAKKCTQVGDSSRCE